MEINRKRYYFVIIIILTCILLAGFPNKVMAADTVQSDTLELPQAVKEKEAAVVKLLVYATDQNKKCYNIRQGNGILVGTKQSSEEDSKIVLTNDELIRIDDTELNNIRLKYGLSAETGLDICVDVVLQVGTRVQTETKCSGDGFVVLELATDISTIESLSLGNSSSVNLNDKLYLLGYGGNRDILGQEEIANPELESTVEIVTSVTEDIIVTDYQAQAGDVGMPVLNANGYVVGMFVEENGGLCIKPIDKIKAALDVLSISYAGVDTGNHYNEVTEEIYRKLNTLLLECQELAMETDTYTEKSIDKLKEAIRTAMEVVSNNEATYDQYESAMEGLEKYKGKLKRADYPIRMIQLGLAAGILLFLLLGIRMKYQIKRMQKENQYNFGGLTENDDVIYAKLIRLDTMQEIPISNVIFRIGKNAEVVDYVIEDNTSISRHHANIMRKGNEFFILDNNSTNHTFVNGEQISPGQYVVIEDGDFIRLSDIDFRFEV